MPLKWLLAVLLHVVVGVAVDVEVGQVVFPARAKKTVSFQNTFSVTPLVFISSSTSGTDPAAVKLLQVTPSNFEAVIVEPSPKDGGHGGFTVSYIAAVPGAHTLPDGHLLEAGTLATQSQVFDPTCSPTGVTAAWATVTFSDSFSQAPAFITMLQTANNEQNSNLPSVPSVPWMVVGVRSVTTTGAEVALDRCGNGQEGSITQDETIGYLAMEPGVGSFTADDGVSVLYAATLAASAVQSTQQTVAYGQSLGSSPLVLASLSSRNEDDGGWVRMGTPAQAGVGILIEEDVKCDAEQAHGLESVSVVAWSQAFALSGGHTSTSSTTSSTTSTTQTSTATSTSSSSSLSTTTSSVSTTSMSATSTSSSTSTGTSTTSTSTTSVSTSSSSSTSTTSVSTTSTSSTTVSITSTSTTSVSSTSTSSTTVSSTSTSTTSVSSTSTSTTSVSSTSTSTTSVSSTSTSTTSVSSTSTSTTTVSSTSTSTTSVSSTSTSTTSVSSTSTSTSSSSTSTSSTVSTTSSSTTSTTSSTTSTTTSSATTTSSSSTSSTVSTTSSTSTSSTTSTTSTTSTSRTSSTSSATTSTSSTTVTVGPPLSPAAQVENLEAKLHAEASERFAELAQAGAGSIQWRSASGVVQVSSIATDSGNASVAVGLEGHAIVVSLPVEEILAAANLSEDESAGLLVSLMDNSAQMDETSSSGDQVVTTQVKSMVSIDVAAFSPRGSRIVNVEDVTPIEFTLGTGLESGLECAYFDTKKGEWSSDGVETAPGNSPDKPFTCFTRHLSFFGAILKGYTNTLKCSQLFVLFTQEALESVWASAWLTEQGSLISWAVLLMLAVTFGIGASLDARRACSDNWGVEFFLVPEMSAEEAGASQLSAKRQSQNSEEEEEEERADYLTACICAVTGGCSSCLGNSAFRDALDDIMSSWFEYFGDARTLCEEICSAVELDGCSVNSIQVAGFRITSRFVIAAMRRLSGAHLGLSTDLISFVMDDEDLNDFLVHGADTGKPKLLTSSLGTLARQAVTPRTPMDVEGTDELPVAEKASWGPIGRGTPRHQAMGPWEFWTLLHHEIAGSLHQQAERYAAGRNCFCMIWDLFRLQNPLSDTFVFNPFMSCKLRALFFSLDILGTLAISILFFQATGSVKGKARPVSESSGACPQPSAEDAGSLGYKIGRLLAVATGSLVVAGIPVALLSSLHTRSFKKLDYPGSRAWNRQLLAWKMQDHIIWTLGSAYSLLCLIFLVLFLANLSVTDQKDFAVGVLLVVSQVCIIIPLVVAIVTPGLAWLALKIATLAGGRNREDLVRRVNQRLYEESNVMLPIQRI